MLRICNVYYPNRILVLLCTEAILVSLSFLLASICLTGPDVWFVLASKNGFAKITGIVALTMLLSYYFDLYEPQRISARWEIYFRLLLVLSVLSFFLAGVVYFVPRFNLAPNVLFVGVSILTILLALWRRIYEWLLGLSIFRERVYVLGNGERAHGVVEILRSRRDIGLTVVSEDDCLENRSESTVAKLRASCGVKTSIDRIVVAMEDRRGSMPVRDLLELRFRGIAIEDAGALLERLSGKLSLDGLNPSNLIFTDGFRAKARQQISLRIISFVVSFLGLLLCLPFLPLIILAVRLSSPGPIFFRQLRVGRYGYPFSLIKFRTMRQDAEAHGAVWATKNDPRVTALGRFMRKIRLDEIPQLWNVLRGEMAFVGPRPERPEFVQRFSKEIRYYELRHMIRPGITGWAQVCYQYGASLEEAKEKLEYDLYYIKHRSLGLDVLIMLKTIKTIVLGRGAQ
jgi:sugar transferase (PEP-CTERM system associated)